MRSTNDAACLQNSGKSSAVTRSRHNSRPRVTKRAAREHNARAASSLQSINKKRTTTARRRTRAVLVTKRRSSRACIGNPCIGNPTRAGNHQRHTRTRNGSLPTQANHTARGARKQPPSQGAIHAASDTHCVVHCANARHEPRPNIHQSGPLSHTCQQQGDTSKHGERCHDKHVVYHLKHFARRDLCDKPVACHNR